STVAAGFLDDYANLATRPATIAWTGQLLAPRTGVYRMQFVVEGRVDLQMDGKPGSVEQLNPDGLKAGTSGTDVTLDAGPHQVRVTLTLDHGGRTVIRW